MIYSAHLIIELIICFVGQAGDYFYIIESGNFTVIIDKKPVGQIGSGKSFGEFALIYDVPRQATIRADTPSTLFALDRQTFKFILANNTEDKATGLSQAIDRVPLLQGLTAAQREKLADSVVLVDYSPGENLNHNYFTTFNINFGRDCAHCLVTIAFWFRS